MYDLESVRLVVCVVLCWCDDCLLLIYMIWKQTNKLTRTVKIKRRLETPTSVLRLGSKLSTRSIALSVDCLLLWLIDCVVMVQHLFATHWLDYIIKNYTYTNMHVQLAKIEYQTKQAYGKQCKMHKQTVSTVLFRLFHFLLLVVSQSFAKILTIHHSPFSFS